MARRRRSKSTIDLGRAWRTRERGSDFQTKVSPLEIRLGPEILEPLGEELKDRYESAIRETRARPKKSTIRRRGPGDFFDVTGRFLRSIERITKAGDLRLVTTRLSPGVKGWLQRRIKAVRPIELKRWLVRSGKIQEWTKTEVVHKPRRSRRK